MLKYISHTFNHLKDAHLVNLYCSNGGEGLQRVITYSKSHRAVKFSQTWSPRG